MKTEIRWFKQLEKVISKMPDTVELAVVDGEIIMLPFGAVFRARGKYGDDDHFSEESLATLLHRRIVTCSSSL